MHAPRPAVDVAAAHPSHVHITYRRDRAEQSRFSRMHRRAQRAESSLAKAKRRLRAIARIADDLARIDESTTYEGISTIAKGDQA